MGVALLAFWLFGPCWSFSGLLQNCPQQQVSDLLVMGISPGCVAHMYICILTPSVSPLLLLVCSIYASALNLYYNGGKNLELKNWDMENMTKRSKLSLANENQVEEDDEFNDKSYWEILGMPHRKQACLHHLNCLELSFEGRVTWFRRQWDTQVWSWELSENDNLRDIICLGFSEVKVSSLLNLITWTQRWIT